jgi:hypothetical protein
MDSSHNAVNEVKASVYGPISQKASLVCQCASKLAHRSRQTARCRPRDHRAIAPFQRLGTRIERVHSSNQSRTAPHFY